ncbi:MAG: antibiotic biosynthesis monooxygenase [Gemmataceae bacterium]|nr:antibiotic biosynthesis monooxygenase [Gemmataceae bacterium]
MIHVIATVEVVDGNRDAFLDEFHKIMPLVRAEAGCEEYEPTVDLATGLAAQVLLRDNVVTIVEKWQSLDALRAHLQAPHMTEYRTRVKDIVRKVTLQVLQPA